MHTEWAVECGAEDPVLVVPWSSPEDASGPACASAFVDLRADPDAIDFIPEAEAHPPLMQALRALNAARSPVFTAKCDAWEMAADELAQLRLDLEMDIALDEDEPGFDGNPAASEADVLDFGFAGYVDCICRDRALFASFPRHEHLLRGITRLAASFDHPHAALECILRPVFLHLESPRQGFAVSVYVKALGESPQRAGKAWSAALFDVVALLRRS
jgi:hypothetical protein